MAKTRSDSHSRLSAISLAGRVLAVIIALTAVLFAAFFAIGFDMPFADDPTFNAPLLTDALLYFTYALSALTAVLAVVSIAHGLKTRSTSAASANGVPAGRIAAIAAGLTVATLIVTFATGSGEPMLINGRAYSDGLWLRLTDMFIRTALILGAVAVVCVACGVAGVQRRIGNKRKTSNR